jgi:hypothetical protein
MNCSSARRGLLAYRLSLAIPSIARGLVTAAALALLLSSAPVSASPETLAQYQARLSRWADTVAAARDQWQRGDPAWQTRVQALAREAGKPGQIARGRGQPITVDHTWLTGHLAEALSAATAAGRGAALDAAACDLASYRAALAPAPRVDRARLRAVVARVVPAAPVGRRLPLAWLRRLIQRIPSWLERLLSRLPSRWGPAPRLLFWVVLGLAGAVLLGGLALAARAIIRRFARSVELAGPGAETGRPWAPPDAEVVLARARQAAAAGAYREAIRHLYLSLLLKLDLAGLLSYQPSKTNWEYLRALRAEGKLPTGEVASLTHIFDRKWYGGEQAAVSDYHQCEQLFSRVLAQAPAGRA